ncbi:complex I subunit 4 family protein [Bacillus taeanensis]|uniref:NADH-quinone oxidoreductase subunit M n=1 Tax=Bacillus taeanensis TaxID=273032 RepID=A0A366XVF2_9BACI|nr:NADH-quinone oxidoreductase subunit M [Bacillus taeanensis]RBW68739.1 NADH-quinone oxidoreductase subunit M [Bacillus taeanensis]
MNEMLLSLLVFSPLLGIIVISFIPKAETRQLHLLMILATLLPLGLAFVIYSGFDQTVQGSQFLEVYKWLEFSGPEQFGIEPFPISYELGVNGISIVMILLTTIICTLSAIAALTITAEVKGYALLFLLLEIGMIGVFAAENLVMFFIFFELTLIPMFFLIGKWGYFKREKAAFSFLIYNGIGSAILLIVFVALFMMTGTVNINELSLYMQEDMSYASVPQAFRIGAVLALLAAFGVKLPIVPLHSWMVRVHVQAPIAVVMIHAGILLKIGAYGLIRLGVGIFPEAVKELAVFLAILGVINLLYGAFLALIQTDLKKVLAYSSVSHMGIVLLGIAALNGSGMQGAIFQLVSHGLISALLFFLIGVIYTRTGTTNLDVLGGMAKIMPLTAGFLLAGGLASLGLPGMSGFVSEFMAFLGLFETMPEIAAVGTLGIILTAVYILRAVLSVTFGPASWSVKSGEDLKLTEWIPPVVLLGFIVLIGVFPAVLSNSLQATLELMMLWIGGGM